MQGSNYPVWWDKTITIYNQYIDKQTQVVSWHRSTINNCFYKDTSQKMAIGDTVLETHELICRIPQSEKFKPVYEWEKLPNDIMSNYFTLGKGDIIVLGEVTDEIDEYTKGKRSTDFKNKYKDLQGCMTIDRVSINTDKGMLNPHYHVKGE